MPENTAPETPEAPEEEVMGPLGRYSLLAGMPLTMFFILCWAGLFTGVALFGPGIVELFN